MTFLQKTDLDPNGFTNNNTAGGQGIALRVGPGSTLQAQIEQAGNGIYYYPGPLQPTHGAPSATNPQQFAQNGNGELFRWNGGSWVLIGNGLISAVNVTTPVNVPSQSFVAVSPIILPRTGVTIVQVNGTFFAPAGDAQDMLVVLRRNGAVQAYLTRLQMLGLTLREVTRMDSAVIYVTAGDVLEIAVYQSGSTNATYQGGITITYVR